MLFSGTLREALDPLGTATDSEVEVAINECGLRTASERPVTSTPTTLYPQPSSTLYPFHQRVRPAHRLRAA
eukprot:159506-Pyramimonas_sp.AAC.1